MFGIFFVKYLFIYFMKMSFFDNYKLNFPKISTINEYK
jgi:hypothetical protein